MPRCRLGPKLMNHCRPREERHGRVRTYVEKIILKLDEGRVPDRNVKKDGKSTEKKKSHKERVQEAKGGN